jgi:hypothetical protein
MCREFNYAGKIHSLSTFERKFVTQWPSLSSSLLVYDPRCCNILSHFSQLGSNTSMWIAIYATSAFNKKKYQKMKNCVEMQISLKSNETKAFNKMINRVVRVRNLTKKTLKKLFSRAFFIIFSCVHINVRFTMNFIIIQQPALTQCNTKNLSVGKKIIRNRLKILKEIFQQFFA